MEELFSPEPATRVATAVELAGWAGAGAEDLPVLAGATPGNVLDALERLTQQGGRVVRNVAVAPARVAAARRRLEEALDAHHRDEPLRPGLEVEALRRALPEDAAPGLADGLLEELAASGKVALERGVASRPGFRPTLTPAQETAREALATLYREAGLAPPAVSELPAEVAASSDLWPLLRLLEDEGSLVALEDGLYAWKAAVDAAATDVVRALGGRSGLGPADFKDVLPVTRKHLLPLLAHLDRVGVTLRRGDGREVASSGGEA